MLVEGVDGVELESKTVLVTGAAGSLGSHRVDRLLAEGYEVVGLDNLMTGDLTHLSRAGRDPRFHFHAGDVREALHVYAERVFNSCVPGLAAPRPAGPVRHVHHPRARGAAADRDGARRCMIVQASTSEVYGDPTVHPPPGSWGGNVNPIGPRACYDEGKRGAETPLSDARRCWGVDARIVRIFNTYGPRMAVSDGRVVSNFIVQALGGEPLSLFGDGKQSRWFCYSTIGSRASCASPGCRRWMAR